MKIGTKHQKKKNIKAKNKKGKRKREAKISKMKKK